MHWRVAEVASLPYQHNVFRCRWSAAWKSEYEGASEPDDPDGRQAVFERFIARLGSASITQCPYHRPNWKLAAALAVERVEGGDVDQRVGALDRETRWAYASFFEEPIFVSGTRLGNGQHRVCAMRVAGVDRCPVEP